MDKETYNKASNLINLIDKCALVKDFVQNKDAELRRTLSPIYINNIATLFL